MPTATFLERRLKFKRSISSIFAVALMIAVIYAIIYFFGYQLSDLWNDWPQLVKQGNTAFHDLQHWVSKTFHINTRKQETYLSDGFEKALASSAKVIGSTLVTLSASLLFLAFTILFTFFILNYRRLLFKFLTTVFTEQHTTKVTEIVREIQSIIKKYVVGLFLQMLIVSTLTTIVLTFLGVKYAILLGVVAGVFNIIPYIGIFSAMLISALITFATAGPGSAFAVLIAFVAIHAVDGNILMPLVVSSKVKINALIAFIAIVMGEMIWGIAGMFLCIPYLAMLKIIFEKVEGLNAWAILLGEEHEEKIRKRKTYRITKNIKIQEAE